ncbi:BamA/TamA family outer membrane protein [Gracilimonas sp.]|uniref:BamA/TamA family outer membrane protein n=1 Tax=Gracilimonas sp. TaxID=1974203 RepID=UPI0032EECED9
MLLLFFGFNLSAKAQNQAVEDSTEFAFLPALAYDSDLGLIAGGIASHYKYRDGMKPFYSFLNFYGIATTRGLISVFLEYDKPYIFDSDQRFYSEIFMSRFSGNQYYGIGNYNELPDVLLDSTDYYLYNSFSAGFDFMLRKPLVKKNQGPQLDIYGKITYEYETPYNNKDSQLIIDDQPAGVNGSHITAIGTGIVWEGRDQEFQPSTGTYLKAGIEVGNKVIGSDYNYLLLETDARAYTSFHLLKKITFANRLFFQHSSGELPYWQLPDLGGAELMRGYPEYRFRDENAILLNSELRTWLFEFPTISSRFGGTLFTDIGRTFPNGESIETIINDLKYTYGFGINASFFTADFILRADVGFSKEDYGIYFTAGYLF